MAEWTEYFTWRGDLTFDRDPLNEVDACVLARFSYIPFEYLTVPLSGEGVTIRDLAAQALADDALRAGERWKQQDDELLRAMADSARYGDLTICCQGGKLDEELQTQFSAVTIRLGEGLWFLSFRGTDNTVVGWKEDLNMSFLCPIPGQEMAAEYARRVAEKLPGRFIFGGHSKGGNLAVYAAAFCGADVQGRIDAVYNYDGPGFLDKILHTEQYRAICGRIHTFVPQFSVVGMLLGREEERTVVHSTETGLMQHDVYSWEVLGPRFICLETVTAGSRFVDSAVKDWIQDMSPEQFRVFVDAIYEVLCAPNMKTMHEMRENWFETARSFYRAATDMDDKTRNAALEALRILARSAEREAVEALRPEELGRVSAVVKKPGENGK